MDKLPFWLPQQNEVQSTNLFNYMLERGFKNFDDFYHWSISKRDFFWESVLGTLNIELKKNYSQILDINKGVENARWFIDAEMNITDSCFHNDPSNPAIIYQVEGDALKTVTYGELLSLTNRVANSLLTLGFKPGDRIAIDMTMTVETIAIYLGIIRMGGIVVTIPESLAAPEIETHLKLSQAIGIFTHLENIKNKKSYPLYQKVVEANGPLTIVVPFPTSAGEAKIEIALRPKDVWWKDFLKSNDIHESYSAQPHDYINILFSASSTGPKAIPWNHTTPIKSAMDGYFHLDIQQNDIICWPSNISWINGPWLIFSALINSATIALYYDSPESKEFGKFIRQANVNILGVFPTLVRKWRKSKNLEDVILRSIKLVGSTGEASSPEDYAYLVSLIGGRPIIEYRGGVEIGGSFLTGSLLHSASPGLFSTPTLGSEIILLNENGKSALTGELFIIPPSVGLSTELINLDHHEIYYANTPLYNGKTLRRQGDFMEILASGFWKTRGRVDDIINLGGIEIGASEIERTLSNIDGINEIAAIVSNAKGGGPSELFIFAVLNQNHPEEFSNPNHLQIVMQQKLDASLNPLFKIYRVILFESMPHATANKILRSELQGHLDQYIKT